MPCLPSSLGRRELLRRSLLGYGVVASLFAEGCHRPKQAVRNERDAQGRRVLHFWNGFTGPDGKTMERLVAAFQKANPDLVVRMQIIPWGTYYDKLTLSLAYGDAPHLFVTHAGRLPEFASYGAFEPMTSHFDNEAALPDGLIKERFAPIPWNATFYKNTQFALPLDVHPICLYYNRTLYKKAGITEPPTTWDAFVNAAEAVRAEGKIPEQWGFVFTWQRTNFLTFAAQHGGGLLSEDLSRATMNTPACLAAAEQMLSLIGTHKVAPSPDGVDAWLAFRQGNAGMALEGIYMMSSLEAQKSLDWGIAPAPRFGERNAVWGGSHLLAQPAGIDAEASADTWRLMRFLSANSLEWAAGGQVPARRDLVASPRFAALDAPAQAAKQLSYVVYEPPSPRANALFPFIDPAIEEMLLGRAQPKKAFADADRRMTQILERP